MTVLKTKDIRRSLTKKGFVEDSSHDHIIFWYKPGEKKTAIRTKISHGKSEISDPLIGKMSNQTRLSKTQFVDLVQCPLSAEEYQELVKDKM